MPFPVFCKRHGHAPPLHAHFDRAFARFFVKGTVTHLHFTYISTVPLPIFRKRHGRTPPLHAHFDRAFARFLQKARSHTSASRTFRPCLCAFLSKGTVAHLRFTHISTVPLHVFCKRHGRPPSSCHLPRLRQSCCSKNDKKWRGRAVLRYLSTWFLSGRRLTLFLFFETA